MNFSSHHRLLLLSLLLAGLAAGCRRDSGTAVWLEEGEVTRIREAVGQGAAAKTEAVAAAEPTGFATIKGTFKLTGTAPPRKALAVNKDQDICMPDGKEVLGEELVVDASGGIKDVVIYCNTKMPIDNPKWIHPYYVAKIAKPIEFDQQKCVFLTHLVAVHSKQPVVLKNSDSKGHNANIAAEGKALSGNIIIAAGSSSNYVAGGESVEPFAVSCNIHPWMSAKMLSRDNPIFVVTDEKGSFEIKNVPAGVPLDFKVWQESSKFIPSAKVNGTAVKWPKGKFSLKDKDVLKDGETRTLDITVDAAVFTK